MKPPGPRWRPAYVGIGSNLETPEQQVRSAFHDLASLPDSLLVLHSSLYRSVPMGPQDQPDFVNAAAALLTQRPAEQFMQDLAQIEDNHGRVRSGDKWGPRILDLDLLVFGDLQSSETSLTLPHPGIESRNFVLLPLSEIAPQLRVPGLGTVAALLAALGTDTPRIEKITER
jgi:2-amino-4-hydroxy-6-hydroxymethyldihydropteridine diphosphokinase